MTKQELSQLRHLHKEIELLQHELDETEEKVAKHNTSDIVKGSNPVWPYEPKIFHVRGVAIKQYEQQIKRLRGKLNRRLKKLIDERDKLEAYIATVEDSLVRTILTLRYVNGLSWGQIANKIGGNTADSVRMIHNRFLG